MRTPDFWRTNGTIPNLLRPVAWVWGTVAARRMRRAPRGRAPIPVVTVGNFTAGGAGKTPVVATLVRMAKDVGLTPAVVSRGHGGSLRGPVRVDPTHHTAREVGDETLLHAALCPTFVSRDRLAGAIAAADAGADIAFLDDGLQNRSLGRDLAIAVVDRGFGVGNGLIMPAGPLRGALDVQFDLVDAVVVTDAGEPSAPSLETIATEAARRGIPVHRAHFVPREAGSLAGLHVVAYAGIGRPMKFAATLQEAGAVLVDFVSYGDHQALTPADAASLLERAAATGATLVTTTKDAARLTGETDDTLRLLADSSRVVAVDLTFSREDEEGFAVLLRSLRDNPRGDYRRRPITGASA